MLSKIKAVLARWAGRPRLVGLANIAEGTHEGNITKLADGAITTRFLLGKFGTDVNHIDANGATDLPVGVITDEAAAAEDPVNVAVLGKGPTKLMVASSDASGVIAIGAVVVAAADGKVKAYVSGAAIRVGVALTASAAAGDLLEVADQVPCAVSAAAT